MEPVERRGALFLRHVEVFEAELGLPSGIGQGKHWGDPDTLEVDVVVYEEFARGLVHWHCRTHHPVIRTLSEGFVATALALARRAGIEVEMPGAGADDRVAVADALDTRASQVDRWMAG